MKRTLVISDIHGCYEHFNKLLQAVNYNTEEDLLLLLGDYVDRGVESKKTLQLVMKLTENSNTIALRGNHDQRFLELIREKNLDLKARFLDHGGLETIKSYCDLNLTENELLEENFTTYIEMINTNDSDHLRFLSQLPYYYEDEHHIYVHAGLNPDYPNWKKQPERDFMWIREAFINNKTAVDKTIIFGHTKTVDIHASADVWFSEGKIGIDGGCAFGHQLNCLEIKASIDGCSYHVTSCKF